MTTTKSEILNEYIKDLTKKALLLIVVGLLGYYISSWFNVNSDVKSIIVGGFILISALSFTSFKRGVTFFSDDLGKRYMKEKSGIVETYSNLEDEKCKTDMQNDFNNAKDISLLLQIGRRELGYGTPSHYFELSKKKTGPDVKIRILSASEDSPFLSKERAEIRGYSHLEWRKDQRALQSEIAFLQTEHNANIEARTHCEPYLWRIFIFDEIVYVSAYLHSRKNDQLAIVYKIEKGENSLYKVFVKYFEYLWKNYDKSETDPIMKWMHWS